MFGCMINDELLVDFINNRLIRIQTNKTDKSFLIGAVIVSDSVINLLKFILVNVDDDAVVSKERILNNVWDKDFDAASTQKLWIVLKELKQKLNSIGIAEDLVVKVKNSHYKKANVNIRVLFLNDKHGMVRKRNAFQ